MRRTFVKNYIALVTEFRNLAENLIKSILMTTWRVSDPCARAVCGARPLSITGEVKLSALLQ